MSECPGLNTNEPVILTCVTCCYETECTGSLRTSGATSDLDSSKVTIDAHDVTTDVLSIRVACY